MNEVKKVEPKDFLDNFGRSESVWMYACSRCGECVDVCPIYSITHDKYTAPGFKIKKLRGIITNKLTKVSPKLNDNNLKRLVHGIYDCTLCGRCWSVCPYNYDLVRLWEKARESVVESGLEPDPIELLIKSIETDKNIFGRPQAARTDWTKGFDAPVKEKAATVYFTGCLLSYRGPLKSAVKATASILNAVGEDWTVLKDEWCCGAPLRFAGGTKRIRDFMDHNIAAIEATGAGKIVFSCPGCYRIFKQEYAKVFGRRFRLLHITELVDEYIRTEKIKTTGTLESIITYHDPCELSRLLGVIDEPRRVLASFATKLTELPLNKFNVKCCGGGGCCLAIDQSTSLFLATERIEHAEKIGATTLTVACPSCNVVLNTAARMKKSNVQVLDFAEVVAPYILDTRKK